MAGANNRQLKAAGWKPAAIQKIRSGQGGALSIRSAMKVADRVGVGTPAKAVQKHGTGSDAPAGWKDAASGKRRQAEDGAKRLAEYRSAAEGHQRASDEGKRANRAAIREQIKRLRESEGDVASLRGSRPDFSLDTSRALNRAREDRQALAGLVRSRDAIANARKAERTPGQMDLFGVPQPKRAESPFDRKMAEKRAREEGARRFVPLVSAISRNVMAARQTAAKNTAKENRAAMVGARLFERLRGEGPRADRAGDRFERIMKAYPGAEKLAKQLAGERTLETRQSIQRMMRTSMGRDTSRAGAGLPATRSERVAGLLSSMKAREGRMAAIKAAAKAPAPTMGKAARKAVPAPKSVPKLAPKVGAASKDDRAAIVAARLMAKGDLGDTFDKRAGRSLRRAEAILAKYPQVNGPARRLARELHYQKLKQHVRSKGRDMTRAQYGTGAPAPETKRLIGMMR